jgi:dTDP-4-amino-4,6-dideoxygalactose transaminase
MDIGTGDEVLIPAHTFIATALAVSAVGATPVTVDVCENTGNIDFQQLDSALTPATRGIIAVHLYGQPADMEPICNFAETHSLRVIEDAAQAHGATYKHKHAGTLADAACFSFYPTKNLGALGDGGAVVTDDTDLHDRLRMLRNYGSKEKYHHKIQGTNSRLDELQAAVLRVKLAHLDEWNRARQKIATTYNTGLAGIDDLHTPTVPEWASPVWHLYALRHPRRDNLLKLLKELGVDCQIHYPFAIHQSPAYAHTPLAHARHPHSENWARNCLSLPIAPYLTESEITQIIDTVIDVVSILSIKAAARS